MRRVSRNVVLQSHGDLKRQTNRHAHLRSRENSPHAPGEHHYTEVVLPGLQAEGRDFRNAVPQQNFTKILKTFARHRWHRLRQLRQIAKFHETAAPESKLAQVVRPAGGLEFCQHFRRETALRRG